MTSNFMPLVESLSSLASKTMTSTLVRLVCTSSGSCSTYNCVACSSRDYFCSVDLSGKLNCFYNESCNTKCSTIYNCGPSEGCLVDSCCSSNGHYILIAKDPS
jgi:hypothetical protein